MTYWHIIQSTDSGYQALWASVCIPIPCQTRWASVCDAVEELCWFDPGVAPGVCLPYADSTERPHLCMAFVLSSPQPCVPILSGLKFRQDRNRSGWSSQESEHWSREPAWGAPPMTKVMRKEARHTQRQDWASGVSLEILEHLPQNQSLPTLLLCALTYTSDFTRGCPPPPLSEKELT